MSLYTLKVCTSGADVKAAMSLRRLLTMLAVLAAVAGLSAIPATSLARTSIRQAADPNADTTDTSGDTTDTSGDTTDTSGDTATVTDCTGLTDTSGDTSTDPNATDTSGDTTDTSGDTTDTSGDTTDTSGDTSTDPNATDTSGVDVTACFDDLGDGVGTDGVDDTDVTDLGSSGGFDEAFNMPGPGTIDETLDSQGGLTARAQIAKVRVRTLGGAHVVVKQAGKVTVHVKLTKQGKRALRNAKRAVHLTLHTRIRLTNGKTITRSKAITVKPKKAHKPKPHKGKKHP
jgi:hypothetical protein